MSKIEWKYPKSHLSTVEIEVYENALGYKIQSDYMKLILSINGSRPKPNKFDTEAAKDRVFRGLISISQKDSGNIYSVLEWIRDRLPRNLVPFADDPAGNYLCFDFSKSKPTVVFWIIETGATEYICDSLSELLNHLH
ncbi:MAG: SMI1/KNR4 family protein [Candidatus Cloacimonetes bacterium]|nr:SMI1/KNR4 family protein [Candidatus Cloacimonadota bacterium]